MALDDVRSVTGSPDGTNVYAAAAGTSNAVSVFNRAADGTLAQKAGKPGCISDSGTGGACTTGKALDGPFSVTVSPDGNNVYVASASSDGVAIFNRAADGTLTQKTGTDGCITDPITAATAGCTNTGRALDNANSSPSPPTATTST